MESDVTLFIGQEMNVSYRFNPFQTTNESSEINIPFFGRIELCKERIALIFSAINV